GGLSRSIQLRSGPMAIDFRAMRCDLSFQASFGKPLFQMWQEPNSLFERLFVNLSMHGLQLGDLKWGQANSVGDVNLQFFLFNYVATVRVRIDRVEIDVSD